jgi:hypothetical protein
MPNTPVNNFTDQAAENQKVHDKLEQQDNPNLTVEFDQHAGDALDKLLEEQKKKAEEEAAGNDDPPADDPPADDPPKVEPNDDDPPGDDPPADDPPKDDDPPADDPPADDPPADDPPADDPFKDAPALPEGASRKSHEAFAYVKQSAAAKLKEYETKILNLEEKVKEAETKLSDPVPEETKKELEELRLFRAKLDIDADPDFRKSNKEIAQAEEFIYSQLLKAPNIDEEIIKDIKKLGGPTAVKMHKILDTIEDGTIKTLVQSKLSDIELTKFNQENAIKSAKENIAGYVQTKQKEYEQQVGAHRATTKQHFDEFLGRFDWTKPKTAKAGATAEEKKEVAAHNQFLTEVQSELDAALQDDSPKMRATLLTGMANFFWNQNLLKQTQSANKQLVEKVKELESKLARFKKASVGRLKDSAAPGAGSVPPPKRDDSTIFTQKTGDALDELRDRMAQEKSRAGV